MPARAFRCSNSACQRPLGQLEDLFDRHGKRTALFKVGRHVVKMERRLFAGYWAECACGEVTKLPSGVKVIFPPEG